MNGDQKHITQ